jgi:hypothetical protein
MLGERRVNAKEIKKEANNQRTKRTAELVKAKLGDIERVHKRIMERKTTVNNKKRWWYITQQRYHLAGRGTAEYGPSGQYRPWVETGDENVKGFAIQGVFRATYAEIQTLTRDGLGGHGNSSKSRGAAIEKFNGAENQGHAGTVKIKETKGDTDIWIHGRATFVYWVKMYAEEVLALRKGGKSMQQVLIEVAKALAFVNEVPEQYPGPARLWQILHNGGTVPKAEGYDALNEKGGRSSRIRGREMRIPQADRQSPGRVRAQNKIRSPSSLKMKYMKKTRPARAPKMEQATGPPPQSAVDIRWTGDGIHADTVFQAAGAKYSQVRLARSRSGTSMMHATVGIVIRTAKGDKDEQAAAILRSIVVRVKIWEGGW